MRINYFYRNKNKEKFDVLTEFIAEEEIKESYNVEEIKFIDSVAHPKFIYNIPGYGIFCFCSEEKQKVLCPGVDIKIKINVHQISRQQSPPLDSYSSKIFLDQQSLFSSLVDSGVSIKRVRNLDDTLEVELASKDFEKIRSDYYLTSFFINQVYRCKESIFYFNCLLEEAAKILISFEDRELYNKACNLLDFTPNDTLSIEKSISKNNLLIDDILSIVNLNSA